MDLGIENLNTAATVPRTFTIGDGILIGCFCFLWWLSMPAIEQGRQSQLFIYKDNTLSAIYPLSQDRSFVIRGHQGAIVCSIEKKRVRVTSADCRNQICVKTGWIQSPFQQIVCAPNHILVVIRQSQTSEALDAIGR
ncbi:MAG: NusG domain II-containing protein [Chitinivibrionales bacterium]|nr:NusG domain II-containing protein [Chitinivibrionales bacterium]